MNGTRENNSPPYKLGEEMNERNARERFSPTRLGEEASEGGQGITMWRELSP